MHVAMLMADGFEDSEFRHPYDELLAAAHEVVVIGPAVGMVLIGKKGADENRLTSHCHQLYPPAPMR
jgi:putative intracellular protease/amidase